MLETKNKNQSNRWFIINLTLLILLITSFLTRLIFSNFSANQTYELSRYTTILKDTRQQNEQLVLASTELQSMDRLINDSARLNLVKVDSVYYLKPQGSVAINK